MAENKPIPSNRLINSLNHCAPKLTYTRITLRALNATLESMLARGLPNMKTMRVGDIIRKARRQKGLTQSELAQLISRRVRRPFSRAALSSVELGASKSLTAGNLWAACQILGLDFPSVAVDGQLRYTDDLQNTKKTFLSEEEQLTQSFRKLPPAQRKAVYALVLALSSANQTDTQNHFTEEFDGL